MPLICFSLVWFPSFKTDINLLSKEAFLGAEQMPAESWNLTLSQQPAGSTHPLLWRVQIWGPFADLHPSSLAVPCPSACCPSCLLLCRICSGAAPPATTPGHPCPAQEGPCLPMGDQWSWGKTGLKRISALAQNNPVVQGLPERWDPFLGTPVKGETSLLNRLLSPGDKSFSRLVFFFFFF